MKAMHFLVLFLLLLGALCTVHADVGKCPGNCTCAMGNSSKLIVSCTQGNLQDPLPVLDMPNNTEILRVVPPEESPNALTLGPIFKGLPSLKELQIVRSGVPALGEYSFYRLRGLLKLNVSYNAISSIVAANFRGPQFLQILDLSHNVIESVPSAVFRHLKFLKELNLSHNRIPEIVPQMFMGLSHLSKLDLSHNPLGEITSSHITHLSSLKEFLCSRCGLLTIEKELLSLMPKIEILDLSDNRLTIVPHIKDSLSLHKLLLNGNLILEVQNNSLNHFPLNQLSLSHNRITVIRKGSFFNTSMEHLDLSFNQFTKMDHRILEPVISKLRFLDISGNRMQGNYLKTVLPKGRQLRHLSIANLGIVRLPKYLFRRSRNLRHLNLSSNSLSDFPHELLYSTPYLHTLDLSNNIFKGLKPDIVSAFRAMSSLSVIELKRNPWMCQECYISHLLSWLKSPKLPRSLWCAEDGAHENCLKCAGPPPMAERLIFLLNEEQLEDCSVVSWATETPDENEDNNNQTTPVTVASFFKDHLALLVGVGCGLSVALLLVVIVGVTCSKKQTALYYTEEPEPEKTESLIKNGNNNDNSAGNRTPPKAESLDASAPQYEQMAISRVLASTKLYSQRNCENSLVPSIRRNSIIQEEPIELERSTTELVTNFYGED